MLWQGLLLAIFFRIAVKQDDILELTIDDYGFNGEGVARLDSFVIFVPFAIKGERVKVKIKYVKKSFAYAELQEVIEESEHRIKPPCNRFTRCGGCDLMHIDYPEQLRIKKQVFENTLRKNYKGVCSVNDVVYGNQFAYRNKLVLPFGVTNGRVSVGFYKEGTHKVVSITKCFLHEDWAEKLIGIILDYANNNHLSVYQEGKGLLRHLVARYVDGFLSLSIVANGTLKGVDGLNNALRECFPDYALYLVKNTFDTNVVIKGDISLIGGCERDINIRGLSLTINPYSFLQVNDYIRDRLYDQVEREVLTGPSSVVIDAYAGVGILGGNLSLKGSKVFNIEIVEQAVEDGKRLAKKNGIANRVEFICGDSAIELPKLINRITSSKVTLSERVVHLWDKYFDFIKSGKKRYELRLLDEKRKEYRVGERLCFISESGEELVCEITELLQYDGFYELFSDLGVDLTMCDNDISIPDAVASMEEIYPKERLEKYKALAIGVKPLDLTLSVILDPPRKGCDQRVLDALNNVKPDKLIYISCNPATLSRDLQILSECYEVVSITPYDMFANSSHLESLTVLKRK